MLSNENYFLDNQEILTLNTGAAKIGTNPGYERRARCIKVQHVFPHTFTYRHYMPLNTQRALSLGRCVGSNWNIVAV
jgi:hypothetical protein